MFITDCQLHSFDFRIEPIFLTCIFFLSKQISILKTIISETFILKMYGFLLHDTSALCDVKVNELGWYTVQFFDCIFVGKLWCLV